MVRFMLRKKNKVNIQACAIASVIQIAVCKAKSMKKKQSNRRKKRMDRSGGYSEEENVQLKIYSDQDTHGMAAWVIIFALVFCGLMYYDSGETRWGID